MPSPSGRACRRAVCSIISRPSRRCCGRSSRATSRPSRRAAGISAEEPPKDGNAIAIGLLRSYCTASPRKAGGAQGFLAAIAETPSLLDPIRAHNTRIVDCLRKAPEADLALISFLVVEGMRSLELFDSNPLSHVECESILMRLKDRLEAHGAEHA